MKIYGYSQHMVGKRITENMPRIFQLLTKLLKYNKEKSKEIVVESIRRFNTHFSLLCECYKFRNIFWWAIEFMHIANFILQQIFIRSLFVFLISFNRSHHLSLSHTLSLLRLFICCLCASLPNTDHPHLNVAGTQSPKSGRFKMELKRTTKLQKEMHSHK